MKRIWYPIKNIYKLFAMIEEVHLIFHVTTGIHITIHNDFVAYLHVFE